MNISDTKRFLEEYSKGITWEEILTDPGFTSKKEDVLDSGEDVLGWTYDDGEMYAYLQTWSEDEPALIVDFNHVGNRMLTKFEAIKKFRCGEDWSNAKAFILEGYGLGDNVVDRIGRKNWEEYLQTSADMAPDVRYVTDPLFQSQVDTEIGNLITKDLAKSIFEEMKFAQEGEPSRAVPLSELLARKIPENKWIVDGLLMKNGKAFFAAKAKTGKTTMCLALMKSLIDGVPFLGKFNVEVPEGNVGYMNLELTDGQVQEWITRQKITDVNRAYFWNLRGKPSPFRSNASKSALINELKELGIKTLIIDTFAKIFPGEANGNSEVNRFLIMLDEFLDKAGVEQLIMLVHAGNEAKKIRGATALTDHPDAIWYLYTDSEKNRFFSADGRDVDIPEGQIVYDKATHLLEFTGSGMKVAKDKSAKEKVLTFIKAKPGLNASAIDDSVDGNKAFKIKIRKQLVKDGLVTVRKGPGNSDLYFAV